MSIHIVATHPRNVDLDSFAAAFFRALELSDFIERESSNYVDERYFRGKKDKLIVEISHTDDEYLDAEAYDIWIDADYLDPEKFVDGLVMEKLKPNGFLVTKLKPSPTSGYERFDY